MQIKLIVKLIVIYFLSLKNVIKCNEIYYKNSKYLKLINKNHLRIVGGINAKKNEIPYIVSLQRRYSGHICGAVILNKNWLLTAAHCICSNLNDKFLKPSNIKGIIGLYKVSDYIKMKKNITSITDVENNDHNDGNEGLLDLPHEIEFKSFQIHPNYNCNHPTDDIALLELKQSINFTDHIKPVEINDDNKNLEIIKKSSQSNNQSYENFYGVVSGWGWTNENYQLGIKSDILQKAIVRVWNNKLCQKSYLENGQKNVIITNQQLCAGYEEGGVDSCWADSGGPLVIKNNSLIGIVSTGIGCGRSGLPGIYTRVSEYFKWIKSTIVNR